MTSLTQNKSKISDTISRTLLMTKIELVPTIYSLQPSLQFNPLGDNGM